MKVWKSFMNARSQRETVQYTSGQVGLTRTPCLFSNCSPTVSLGLCNTAVCVGVPRSTTTMLLSRAAAVLALLAASLLCLGAAGAAHAAVLVPYGANLEDLPGASAVQGGSGWPKNISIALVESEVQV